MKLTRKQKVENRKKEIQDNANKIKSLLTIAELIDSSKLPPLPIKQ